MPDILNGHSNSEIPLKALENGVPDLLDGREATNLFYTSEDSLLILAHGPSHAGYVLAVDIGKPERAGTSSSMTKCDTDGKCLCKPHWSHADANSFSCSVYNRL